MKNKKIEKLKKYQELLVECKRIQFINQLNKEVSDKLPTYENGRQKVLILKR